MPEIADYLFEIVTCAALLVFCVAIHLQRQESRRQRQQIERERDARKTLENDVTALLACSRNIGERLVTQDARQNKMLKNLDAYRDPNEASSYGQVRKMLAQGMEIDEIARICDLRRGEVDLLSHIANHRAAA